MRPRSVATPKSLEARALSLDPAQERALTDRMQALIEDILRSIRAAGHELRDAPQRSRQEWLDQLEALLDQHADELQDAASMHRELRRMRWRLALSAMDQVEHELSRRRYQRLSREDLRQAGLLGLFEAARRFEASRGHRFSTYARWWVRAYMNEAVGSQEYVVRLPNGAQKQLRHVGEPRTLNRRQEQALSRVRQAVSIEAPEGDGRTVADRLVAEDSDPSVAVERKQLLRRVRKARQAGELSNRHHQILAARYGLEGTPRQTYRDLGRDLGVSGERVRQLERQALKRMRPYMEESKRR